MRCHNYIFFDIEPSIHAVAQADLKVYKTEFARAIETRTDVRTSAYATLGFTPRARVMLHLEANDAKVLQQLVREMMHTELGKHLKITYTLFGMTRTSQYAHGAKEAEPKEPKEIEHEYLIVYPFTKTIEWHLLPYEQRREIMKAHVAVGRPFGESIAQLLLYSFGVDDHEFIVSYQTNSLLDFQTLVMELRGTEGRRYTLNDTPIFTCVHMPLIETLDML